MNPHQYPAAPGLPVPNYGQPQHHNLQQHQRVNLQNLQIGPIHGPQPQPQPQILNHNGLHQGNFQIQGFAQGHGLYNHRPNIPVFNAAPGIQLSPSDLQKLHSAIESLSNEFLSAGSRLPNHCAYTKTIKLLPQYEDRIFPNELTVKARLKYLGSTSQMLQTYTAIYSMLPYYTVGKTARSGNQVAILFKHGYEGFKGWVDATSDDDVYPQELWENFEDYLKTLCHLRSTQRHCPISFHRGRYGMAIELQKQNLDFFKDRSLGEICHIVELAIQKKLLLYENNMLLPALACDSLTNAMHGRPTATAGRHHMQHDSDFIQTMDELKGIIFFLLENYPEGFNLSTLKTKIRNVFGKRLSETVFHQTKLLDLVQLPPLDQIVNVVKLEGNCGYLCTQKMIDLPESTTENAKTVASPTNQRSPATAAEVMGS